MLFKFPTVSVHLTPTPAQATTMPRELADRRKSSLGARRGPPRQHIPFRADDLARGKKTGIAVRYVDRNSDEFEPFDELMKQADSRTPPRIKSRKKRMSVATPVPEEVDEDGEMSMDLAESNQGSPLAYFTNANLLYAPNSARKLATSRPVTRPSEIDYDQVPSPKPRMLPVSKRASIANGAGPSSLSRSPQGSDPISNFETADPPGYGDDYEHPLPDESPNGPTRTHSSPNDVQEDEDEAAEVEREVAQLNKADKGKRRADPVDDEEQRGVDPTNADGLEDGIAHGLQEAENGEDDEEEGLPPTKKSREEQGARKSRVKRVVKPPVERSPTPEGVRRGRRHRYKPLEYWRQEKVVYGRRESGLTLVPQIKEIIRIPQEPPKPLGKGGKRKRGTTATRGKSKTRESQTPFNPEDGWDDDTPTNAVVIDYDREEQVSRRVAFLAKMIDPKPAANSSWFFQKIFGEGNFIAAGQMRIPPKGRKPSKSTKDNTYVFYVIEGAVSVFIHETPLIITTGGMFLVPRGNTYYIENIAERDAKLFFTQARKVTPEDEARQATAEDDGSQERVTVSEPPASHRRSAFSEEAPVSAVPKRAKSRV
ncbi:Mif2/CENP-C like-domain-containing protein [Phlebopus sp. FC_14]|nr:Mif2/CENP-C like-domain-containing protein [Phlebopus sp. FC_14]